MTVGLIFYTLADTQINPDFETYGVVTVCGALVADALIGNIQEKAMKKHQSSNTEMVLYSYSIGSVYILLWQLFYSDLFLQAINFCLNVNILSFFNPMENFALTFNLKASDGNLWIYFHLFAFWLFRPGHSFNISHSFRRFIGRHW